MSKQAKPFIEYSQIWDENEDGLFCFMQFGLIKTLNDNLLAFAEGRIKMLDEEPHHIVMKRSIDQGKTWESNQYIIPSINEESYANPTPVLDETTGEIFLFYAKVLSLEESEIWYISSKDNGNEWSKAINVTAVLSGEEYDKWEWKFFLPGPFSGLQLRDGTLVMPVRVGRRIGNDRAESGTILYSIDNGSSWSVGGSVPVILPIVEPTILERENGDLFMNARCRWPEEFLPNTSGFDRHERIVSVSKDKGMTWSEPNISHTLPKFFNTACHIYRYSYEPNITLWSSPAHTELKREDLSIRISFDEGESWSHTKLLQKGFSCNGTFTAFKDGSIGFLYGMDYMAKNHMHGTEQLEEGHAIRMFMPAKVGFARFNIEWVKETT